MATEIRCDFCGRLITRESNAEQTYSVGSDEVFSWLKVSLTTFRRDTNALTDKIDLCLSCFAQIVLCQLDGKEPETNSLTRRVYLKETH